MIYLGLIAYIIIGFVFHDEEQSGSLNNLLLPGALIGILLHLYGLVCFGRLFQNRNII
jgi:hypothetical protein